jgi:uncharacterized SAM-dependent methyltransferase
VGSFTLKPSNARRAFLTAMSESKVGDEFLVGSDLRKLRIVAIANEDPPPKFSGIWVVAPA